MNYCGIYKITNTQNGKVYIGQAVDILMRWRQHCNEAYNKNGVAYECKFYRAIRKYGISNFTFQMIESCEVDKLNQREIFYIEKFNSYHNGYNMTTGGQDVSCTTARAIDQYDLNGNLVKTYKSIADAKREVGGRIDRVLSGESRTAGGFYFSYHGDGFNLRDIKSQGSVVCQYTLDGRFIKRYNTIKDAIDETGLTGISYACRKHTKAGDWLWVYEGDEVIPYEFPKYNHPSNVSVDMLSKNSEYIRSFMSIGEAERCTGVLQSNIVSCCRGKTKSAGGYKWKYSDNSDEA